MTTGPCNFCNRAGPIRVSVDEEESINEDIYVCNQCWKLLQNPATALPLIRGDLSISLRGKMPKAYLQKSIDAFIEKISEMKPKN